MADSKITGLTADTSPTTDDLVVTVNDPGGTPANRKVTIGNLMNQALVKNPYKFKVYRNSAQNTGNGAFALLACDTKVYDTSSNVDVVTNKGRFTAPVAGFYHFDATVGASLSAITNELIVSLYVNGSEVSRGTDTRAAGLTENIAVSVSDTLQLAASDYVEVYVFGTAAYAILVGNAISTHFSGFLVSIT